MQQQLRIRFHGVEPSEAVEVRIREKVAELERITQRITSLNVTVEAPHHHKHKGNTYSVRLNIHLPDKELVVTHCQEGDPSHEDAYVAVRDAFSAAARQLQSYAERRRFGVGEHELQEGDLAGGFGYD